MTVPNKKSWRKRLPDLLWFASVLALLYFLFHPFADFGEDPKEGIQFQRENWESALAAAKLENKAVFLNIYAAWCAPCRRLKAKSFSNQVVGQFYNTSFINVSLYGESERGRQLMKKYRMPGFPSLLFLDGNGNIISRKAGFFAPEELFQMGNEVINTRNRSLSGRR